MDLSDFQKVLEIKKHGHRVVPVESVHLAEQREKTKHQLLKEFEILKRSTIDELEQGNEIRPVVVAVGVKDSSSGVSFLYPVSYVDDPEVELEARKAINKELLLNEAQGTIERLEGTWQPTASSETQDALMFSLQTYGWKRLYILPYTVEDGHVEMHSPEVVNDYDPMTVVIYERD